VVEAEGVRRAQAEMARADRVLFVVDSSDAASMAGLSLDLDRLPAAVPRTLVFNKVDSSGEAPRVEAQPDGTVRIFLSAATGAGLDGLRRHLKDCLGFSPSADGALSARTRHLDALRRARAHVEAAQDLLTGRHAGELVAQELREAHQALGEITGEVSSDELLGRIFSSFCIGK
jgi:tRNA modification GTPase